MWLVKTIDGVQRERVGGRRERERADFTYWVEISEWIAEVVAHRAARA